MPIENLSANRLLALLPPGERELLATVVRSVSLRQGEVLFEESSAPPAIWFPLSSAASLVTITAEGELLQTTMIGNDGAIGMSLALGGRWSPQRAQVDIGGEAVRLNGDDYRANQAQLPVLQKNLLLYADFLTGAMGHWATCHAYHHLEERCAGWLLTIARIIGSNEFVLTHESLAAVVGATRPNVTAAMGTFRRSGLIEYGRGSIRITDPDGLEATACSCHRNVAEHYAAILAS